MSHEPLKTGGTGGGDSSGDGDVFDGAMLKPTIRAAESVDAPKTSVTPVAVTSIRGLTENSNTKHRTLCGDVAVEPVSEDEWRVTINGFVTKSQLQTLISMRPAGNVMYVDSEVGTFQEVEFDRFRWEQTDELNRYVGEADGVQVDEPLFEFQLQTRDDDTSG